MVSSDICSSTMGDGQRSTQDQDNESEFVPSPNSVGLFLFLIFQMHQAHLALSSRIVEKRIVDVSKKWGLLSSVHSPFSSPEVLLFSLHGTLAVGPMIP